MRARWVVMEAGLCRSTATPRERAAVQRLAAQPDDDGAAAKGCAYECITCGSSATTCSHMTMRQKPVYRSPVSLADNLAAIGRLSRGTIVIPGDLLQGGLRYASAVIDEIENMETLLREALKLRCTRIDVFYMIGLQHQTYESVMETVDYCETLFRFGDRRLQCFISPMGPFLDPGSQIFEDPEAYGFRKLAYTLEEHRQLLVQPSWEHILNYETEWMTRARLVDATYDAAERLNEAMRNGHDDAGIARPRLTAVAGGEENGCIALVLGLGLDVASAATGRWATPARTRGLVESHAAQTPHLARAGGRGRVDLRPGPGRAGPQ